MSYILNALRKSEQERQAVEPDTVTTRILSPQPQHPKNLGKLIAALVISNLLVVAYFIWFNQKAPTVAKPDTAAITAPVKPAAAPDAKAIASDSGTADPAPTPALTPDVPLEKTPSIADLVAAKKASTPKPQVKPIIDKKPAVAPIALPSPEEQPETPPAAEPVVENDSPKPVAAPEKKGIPFLYEMPSEFRHDVPRLNINVFVYAKAPLERFVMIDMVKYKTGEMIKDGLELKEIRHDSLVLQYRNQTFQIERP